MKPTQTERNSKEWRTIASTISQLQANESLTMTIKKRAFRVLDEAFFVEIAKRAGIVTRKKDDPDLGFELVDE